jgi:hypothetical protein
MGLSLDAKKISCVANEIVQIDGLNCFKCCLAELVLISCMPKTCKLQGVFNKSF